MEKRSSAALCFASCLLVRVGEPSGELVHVALDVVDNQLADCRRTKFGDGDDRAVMRWQRGEWVKQASDEARKHARLEAAEDAAELPADLRENPRRVFPERVHFV